ncbi:glycosyltransferase [Nocardioides glacieisoli]|uniref:Glycosyltransferase n=1 Tax=Nocardioides glacieisoli TaxID=1168730 RepID=A0A4Q2RTG5_9ACTN|nr:glycosyltransferase [Nocardioides glacieisoli]RYB92370.1 glycosyltransferase [Nocardioides glacieisoli]
MAVPDSHDVTVVLTSYNHERFLEDAFASLVAQDHPHIRVIVTDDASTDSSVDVIERLLQHHGVDARRIFHATNEGLCQTLNEALELVETPYVVHLSGDDWMAPDRVSKQVSALAADPDAALVYGDAWIASTPSAGPTGLFSDFFTDDWRSHHDGELFKSLLRTDWIPAPSVMARTDALRSVGGYDESLPVEDYDMWLRLAAAGHHFLLLEEPLVTWRRWGNSQTDVLQRTSKVEQDILDLRVWGKHLGHSREIDAWLAPRLAHIAIQSLKSGSRSPVLTRVLRAVLKAQPSFTALGYYAAARFRQVS